MVYPWKSSFVESSTSFLIKIFAIEEEKPWLLRGHKTEMPMMFHCKGESVHWNQESQDRPRLVLVEYPYQR